MHTELKGPMAARKYDISTNPKGTELKVEQQREKEKHGRFVTVCERPLTRIFVRNEEDKEERKRAFLEKMRNRPNRWN